MTVNPFNFRSYEIERAPLGALFHSLVTDGRAELLREGEGHHHTRIVSRRLAVKNRAVATLWRTVPSPSG